MYLEAVQKIYDFDYWATSKLLDMAADLPNEQFLAVGDYPHGGMRPTLTHLLFGQWLWLRRLKGKSPRSGDLMPLPEDYPDVSSLRSAWKDEEAQMRAFLAGLTDEDMEKNYTYTTTKGITYTQKIGDILMHLALHGMQHRAEVAQMLTQLGHSPGDIDYIVYLRQL